MFKLGMSEELEKLINDKFKRVKELQDLIYKASPLEAEKKELETLFEEIDFLAEEVELYEFEEKSEY
jgi:hypothetical protein